MSLKKTIASPIATAPTIAANPGVSSTDRATWSEQADRLARNHARAEAAQWAPIAGAVVLVVSVAVYWLADVDFLALALGVFAALLTGAVVLAVRVSWVYSHELRLATRATERATWAVEEAAGQDLTGDGYIGDPFRGIKVPRKGGGTDEITFSHPPASRRGEPIMEGWGVSKSDLVAMLYEAEMVRGLQERAWVGDGVERFVMPSGKQVTQSIFRGVLAALAEHDMASKPDGKWRLDVEADDVAASLAKP
jgi:hypothetical protein